MRKIFGPLSTSTRNGFTEGQFINSSATGAITLDNSSANVFVLTLTGNITITLTNRVPVGTVYSALLYLKNTSSRTVTYPASFKWPAGAAPATSSGATAIDVVSFVTIDGGVTYQAAPIGFNFS